MVFILVPFGGSSPLARGLRRRERDGRHERGIIPARAGFTRYRRCCPCRPWDHPRSRGVYLFLSCSDERELGSSPLARGLRRSTIGRRVDPRIIPARAGFTTYDLMFNGTNRDHPRSRGVYCPEAFRQALRGRIIPARAGFTPGDFGFHGAGQDHPRSRGVYIGVLLMSSAVEGSSPLARGLRGIHEVGDDEPGIIPARAGFTVQTDIIKSRT